MSMNTELRTDRITMCVLSSLAASIAAVASAAHFQQGEVRPGVIFAITAIVWTVTVGLTAARG